MSMGEERDDAGQPVVSTPDAGSGAAPAETSVTQTEPTQLATETEDRERETFDRLAAEAEGREWKKPAAADPSPAKPGQSAGEKPAAAEQASEKPPIQPEGRKAGYEGLSDASYQALSRTKLLPSPEDWKATAPAVRANLITAAQAQISTSSRAYAAQQQLRQQQQSRSETIADPSSRQGEGGRQNVRANVAGTGQATRPATSQGDPDPEALLKPVRDLLGEEHAAPIKQALEGLLASRTQLQQQNDQAMREQQARHEAEQAQSARDFYAPQEQSAIEQLSKLAPSIDFDDPGHRDAVLQNALVHFNASVTAGQKMTWEQAIVTAGKSMFQTDIQQAAQQALLNRRGASLRGSPERGTAQTAPTKTPTPADREKAAYERLERKEASPDQIRATL